MASCNVPAANSRSRASSSAFAPATKLSKLGVAAGEISRGNCSMALRVNLVNSSMSKGLSYRDAGVDIDAGDALVEAIKPFAKRTLRPEVLAGIGGFGALVELPKKYRHPVLVSGTDGVGTKLKLAFAADRHDTIGIDLVAMSVNDILTLGAEPLFFLDYYGCGKLDVDTAAEVVKGIAAGCERA